MNLNLHILTMRLIRYDSKNLYRRKSNRITKKMKAYLLLHLVLDIQDITKKHY